MAERERPGFEEALSRLESIVTELEDESITLEESIKLYEEGIELSRICTEILEHAEQRIEKVNDQKLNEEDKEDKSEET
ncbi:MAG: exodeoxyribonuclease VII small subunit [Balneolaceae bacterium]|nr:exodeoxyribonuclease VII small subunit [Balneolaceae bacterium]